MNDQNFHVEQIVLPESEIGHRSSRLRFRLGEINAAFCKYSSGVSGLQSPLTQADLAQAMETLQKRQIPRPAGPLFADETNMHQASKKVPL